MMKKLFFLFSFVSLLSFAADRNCFYLYVNSKGSNNAFATSKVPEKFEESAPMKNGTIRRQERYTCVGDPQKSEKFHVDLHFVAEGSGELFFSAQTVRYVDGVEGYRKYWMEISNVKINGTPFPLKFPVYQTMQHFKINDKKPLVVQDGEEIALSMDVHILPLSKADYLDKVVAERAAKAAKK